MELEGTYEENDALEDQFNEEFHDYSSDSDMSPSDDENEHKVIDAKDKKKRGLTRLPKMRSAYTNSGGKKHKIKFDAFGRFSGKYRSEFVSFLGDLVREKVNFSVLTWREASKELRDKLWEEITRYYEVDEDKRKVVMTRLGLLLRSFRSRVFKRDIHPNLGKPEKLARIPRRFRTIILNQDHWDSFVAYTQSDKFKDSSDIRKEARAKSRYNHRLGRGGYATLEEKMLANNEVEKDVPPSRCLMWYKARQNKDGEIEDEEVKTLAQQLQSPSHSSGSQKNQTAYSVGQNDDTVTDHILQLKQSTKESSKTVKNNVESSPVQVNTPSPKGERTIKCRLAIVSKRHVVASGRIYLSEGLQTCHNVPVQEDCYKVSIDRSIQDAAFLPHEIPDARTVGDAVGSFVPWPKDLCIIDDDQQTENQKVDDFTNGTTTKHVDGQQRNQPKDSKVKKTPKTKGQVQYVQLKNIKSKLTRSSNNAAAKLT